ncbi:hypothetical protein [Methylocystis iwaonis]|uniref:hypothetical protein n=1 Tax=Methylocystis iwaonis TaxID=2885079 RepID=UPI002E7B8215|nr:hypothetical protein [Methylocystis iwaonis]
MLGVGLVLLYFALALLAAAIILQSDRYMVRRSIAIDAGTHKLFNLASDPARWSALGAAAVIESRPDALVVLQLDLGRTESVATVGLHPEGGQTFVDCMIAGRNTFADKIRNLLGSREKTLGPKIEQALADLAASA